jgi:hypothetical protein
VIVTDLGEEWVAARLPHEDLSAPLCPPFLSAMEAATGKRVNNIDILTMAPPEPGEPDVELSVIEDSGPSAGATGPPLTAPTWTVYRAEGRRADRRTWRGRSLGGRGRG